MMKRVVAVILCLMMMLGCCACDSEPERPKAGNTITFAKQTSGAVQQSVLGPLGESWEENRWIEKYRQELDLDVQYDWLVDSSQYFEKLNLMMSRGELPDVFLVDTNRFYQLQESGMLQSMTGLFEEYASDELKAYFADAGQAIWDAATVDGELYAIPNLYSPLDRMQYLWIRTDWLEKLGLEEPTSLQDVLEISTAFTTQDPDGNGQNDTYGFGVCGKPDIWRECYSLKGLFAAFGGMEPRLVADENGNITKTEISEENRYALEQIAKLVEKGEIDPNFSTLSQQQITEAIGQNRIGMFFGEHWVPQSYLSAMYGAAADTNPDYEWKAFPIYDMEGNFAKQSIPLACNGWYAVSKDYAQPEMLIKMLNVYVTACAEDPSYYMDSQEVKSIWAVSPVSLMTYMSNVELYDDIHAVLKDEASYESANASVQNSVDIIRDWRENKKPDAWAWHTIYDENGAFSVLKQYLEAGVCVEQDYYYEIPASAANFGAVLDQIRDQYYMNVILGKASITEYDAYVQQWLGSGGQMMLDDLNQIYSQVK